VTLGIQLNIVKMTAALGLAAMLTLTGGTAFAKNSKHSKSRDSQSSVETSKTTCWPEVAAEFSLDSYWVTTTSTKDLSNVVLLFADGTTQRFEGLTGKEQTFSGTDSNEGKMLTGAWIKSGCNKSGDGPGYGEFAENTPMVNFLPVVSIGDVTPIYEFNDLTLVEAEFQVTLSEVVPFGADPVTVDFATANGTAFEESDFLQTEGTVTFGPGEISKTVTVFIIGEDDPEDDEVFHVDLSNPQNAVIGKGRGDGSIVDDDWYDT